MTSISAIGLGRPFFDRHGSTSDASRADRSHHLDNLPATAESSPDSLELSDAYRQRESLSIRARTKVSISDDGTIETQARAKLRYKYDFVSADGSKISVRLKANLNFKQFVEGDEFSQSLKLSVKASVKTIQQDVSSANASLQQVPGISADIGESISHALALFGQVTDASVGEFTEGDTPDGDQLIAGIVDAFNRFADTVLRGFLPAGESQPVLPDDGAAESQESSVGDVADETVPEGSIPTTDELPPPPQPPQQLPAQIVLANNVNTPSTQPPAVADSPVEPASDDSGENNTGVEATDEESPPVELATGDDQLKSAERTATAILFKLRLQTVKSLTSLAGKFDSESDDAAVLQSAFKFSAKLTIRSQSEGVSFGSSFARESICSDDTVGQLANHLANMQFVISAA